MGSDPDAIVMGDVTYGASGVQRTVERHVAGVAPDSSCAAQLAYDGGLLLVAETAGDAAALRALASAIVAAVAGEHGVAPEEVVLVAPGTLPRDEGGRVSRAATVERYRRGELAVRHVHRPLGEGDEAGEAGELELGAWTTPLPHENGRGGNGAALTAETMRRAVIDALGGAADDVPDDDDDLTGWGLDSIKIMELANAWRRAGASIAFAEMLERPTLRAWTEIVAAHAAAAQDGAPVDAAPSASAPDDDAPFELTPVQHAYWVGRGDGQPLGGVGCHFYAELDGAGVDPERLERAVRALIARHAMLRARFLDDGTQHIGASAWRGLTVHDLRDVPPGEAERGAAVVRELLSHRRLEVERGESFDVQLSLLAGDRTRVHVNVDLLVADVLSIRILFDDLARLYAEPGAPLPPLAFGFARYLSEQSPRRAAAHAAAQAFWRARLDGMPLGPQLPLATEPERVRRPQFVRREHRLGPAARERLGAQARAHGVTVPMALAAAFAQVLGAWSESPRFLLNVPLFDREIVHPDVAHLVADFTNLILLEVDAAHGGSFAERARALQARFRADVGHSAYSGVEVLRDLARARGAAAAPVVFTSAIGIGDLVGEHVRRTIGRPGWMISQTPQTWLDHQAVELGDELLLNWDAVDELFPAGMLDAMFGAYTALLARLTAPDADWDAVVAPLVPAEQLAVRAGINATSAPESGRLLHEAFFARAVEQPERIALAWGESGTCTYGELADRALRVAALLGERGVQPGEPVAVTLPKGAQQVEAVLGILAAGAVYVPVGADQPVERRARICANAGVRIVVSSAAAQAALEWPAAVTVVGLEEADGFAPLEQPLAVEAESPAYVIYTSGSTGEPKGVEITHRAAVNTIEDVNARYEVTAHDRVLAISALDFDLSVYDIFGLLAAGGGVVLIEEADRREPRAWSALLQHWNVTVWNTVPALLDMLLTSTLDEAPPSSLRVALVSGDWVGLDLRGRLRAQAPQCKLIALGGATEAAIWSNAFEVDDVPAHWRSIPYGYPLRNQLFRVADEHGGDRPDWVPGELWIGGAGVARGYRGQPELTARQFVTRGGARWYRTGDLGRYWPDGTLEFLGRVDHQVKIGGHRIELGEIESALLAHDGVAQAVAVTLGERPKRLAAAVVANESRPLGGDALRAWLASRLPAYMIPELLVVIERLPLSANGKIDRKAIALQLSHEAAGREAFEPPRGPLETAVAELWAELLGAERVGRGQSFFALGGDSLIATRVVTRLRRRGLAGAELANLFAAPVLADFAATLREGDAAAPAPLRADPAQRHEPFPLTDVQRAYWLGRDPSFVLGGVGCHYYTEFDGADVDLARLEAAWNALIARHEMLRAVVDADGRQRILREVPRLRIPVADARGGDAAAALGALREAMSHQVLDPARWPVFDVRAVRYGANRARIGVSLDNILLDAASCAIVYDEVAQLYADPAALLPPAGALSFRDYVLGVVPDARERAAAERYWTERAADLPPAPQLPLRADPAQIGRPRFVRREARLSPERWRMLAARARGADLTASALLATAFAETLGAWSARDELTINLTLFDRRDVHPDVGAILGDFTSLLLVAHRPVAGESWTERARRLQQQVSRDLEHSTVSAVWVLRELARQRGTDVTMPVVFTSTLGATGARVAAAPIAERVWSISQTPQVWLDHQVVEVDDGLLLSWDAVDELFPAGMLDAMFGAYTQLLERLAAPDANWDAPVAPLIPPEQLAVRAGINATSAPESGRLLHEAFFARAAEQPERIALAWGENETVTYGELAERALRIAALLAERGVQPGEPVAVTLPKGAQQVEAVLGILAAGAVYVPVGIDQPVERHARISANAGVRVVVDALALRDADRCGPLSAPIGVSPESLAYVIYTSGSTGEPKGVEVTHRAAVNTIEDVNARYGVSADDRVLAISALDFDLSVYDIFGLLAAGGGVVLIEEADRREPRAWSALLQRWNVTVWNTVPALLDMLLTATLDDAPPSSLRVALVSGDWVGLDLPGRLRAQAPQCKLIALGGATEAAIWSNAFEVDEVPAHWRSIPYGYPLRNQSFRVADERGGDRPDWAAGELWIGGAGVARGYRGQPELTARQFVQRGGSRWYRTGDLGRYWPDGTLEFLGRVDQQVKIGGHRVELGEIESALLAHDDVAQAVAVTVGDRNWAVAAFVVPAGGELDLAALTSFTAARVPAYAVPRSVTPLERLPLTANGKVDRAALARLASAAPAPAGDGDDDAPPSGPVELALAALWAEFLDLDVRTIGRGANFIALGGHSVMATRMAEAIRRRFGVALSLRELFAAPTVAALAAVVGGRGGAFGAVELEEDLV